jgi:hypothetical protein
VRTVHEYFTLYSAHETCQSKGMRLIDCGKGRVAQIDAADLALVSQHKWTAYKVDNVWYAYTGGRRRVSMHGLLTGYALTDHIDGNGLNNTRINLREATKAQNAHNSRMYANNTTGVKGVTFNRHAGKFHARVKLHGKSYNAGYHLTVGEAEEACVRMRAQLHGAYARST